MPNINLKIELIDKKHTFPLKSKYDTETRIAQVQRSLRQTFPTKFLIDPDHIYVHKKRLGFELKAYVDNAHRASISMEANDPPAPSASDTKSAIPSPPESQVTGIERLGISHSIHSKDEVDGKMSNILGYLIEERFWKSLIAKAKLSLSTILILLFAGGGLFYLIRDIILPIFGVH